MNPNGGAIAIGRTLSLKFCEMRSDVCRSAWSDGRTIDCDDSCTIGGNRREIWSDEYVCKHRPRNGNISGSRIDNIKRTQTHTETFNIDVNTF